MENIDKKITLKQIIWYSIIFSIFGLIIETLFCYLTTGVLESRKTNYMKVNRKMKKS